MLTIHMKGRTGNGGGILSQLDVHALFRTLRLVGEVPFIEPRDGMLLNLTLVERIEFDDGGAAEQAEADEDEELAARLRAGETVEPPPRGNWGPGQARPRGAGSTQWNG